MSNLRTSSIQARDKELLESAPLYALLELLKGTVSKAPPPALCPCTVSSAMPGLGLELSELLLLRARREANMRASDESSDPESAAPAAYHQHSSSTAACPVLTFAATSLQQERGDR